MVEFSPVSGAKKIHDTSIEQDHSLPEPARTLPAHKGENTPNVHIDGPGKVMEALDLKGHLAGGNKDVLNALKPGAVCAMALAVKQQLINKKQ